MDSKCMTSLDSLNFEQMVFRFNDRQAGVSSIYDPEKNIYTYNVYCLEIKLLKEIFSVEFTNLNEALELANHEFGNWELQNINFKKRGCCCTQCPQKK